jgi:hypothetical protein
MGAAQTLLAESTPNTHTHHIDASVGPSAINDEHRLLKDTAGEQVHTHLWLRLASAALP